MEIDDRLKHVIDELLPVMVSVVRSEFAIQEAANQMPVYKDAADFFTTPLFDAEYATQLLGLKRTADIYIQMNKRQLLDDYLHNGKVAPLVLLALAPTKEAMRRALDVVLDKLPML